MKKILLFTGLIIVLGGTAYFMFNAAGCKQKQKIAELEERIEHLQSEYVPIRFKVLDRDNNNIRVAVKFYDGDGNVIERTTKILEGNELSIDFYVVPISGRYLAFPFKIFTDKTPPDEGEQLTKYYDADGFPEIYESKNLNKKLRGGLEVIFRRIKNDDFDADDKYFGNMVHDITDLKSYKTGSVYRIVCRTKGGIEVIED